MPTPAAGYRNAGGLRLPSVTTIIGRFKESGALLKWAYNTGRDHGELSGRGLPAPDSLYAVSKKAADIGTSVHSMVEAFIKGEDPEPIRLVSVDPEKALSGFQAFRAWWDQSRMEVIAQEVLLVSEKHRYGGTPDAIGRMHDGRICLLDWKTSNSVYADHLIQLAAYKQLWDENHPEQPITGGFHLCRFAKEHGDFGHHYYPALDEAWKQFLLYREAYDLDKQLTKRAA